jgi:hypothetical protein
MNLAEGLRPRTAFSWLALILIGSGLLAGCQSATSRASPQVEADGWRVVERLGDARYLAPDASGWSPAIPATTLPSGSQVVTGTGGRVILARTGDHLSAGPASRFSLPPFGPGAILKQHAGWLRYRIADAAAQTMVVETPFLAIEVRGTVFDVTVSETATEVSVERGQVRIATPDGRRQIELEAGQSAYASGPAGDRLAFRRGQGEPLEPVAPIILPAMHPKAGVSEGRPLAKPLTIEDGAANRSGTAASEAAVPIATAVATANSPARSAGTPVRRAERSAADAIGRPESHAEMADANEAPAVVDGLTPADAGEVDRAPLSADPAASTAGPHPTGKRATEKRAGERRGSLFDRLTEGMVDAVPAARPPQEQPDDAPSI